MRKFMLVVALAAGIFYVGGGATASGAQAQVIEVSTTEGRRLRALSAADLDGLPTATIRTATPWSESALYEGPRLIDVLKLIGREGAATVRLIAADDYSAQLTMTEIERYNPILARKQDGKPLGLRTRGPYWLMFPFDDVGEIRNDAWYYRAVWQITRITLSP